MKNKKGWAKKFQRFFACSILSKNKKGWTAIVEVFVSILLLAGILTLIVNNILVQDSKKSEIIYEEQALISKMIQLDDGLRQDVLNGTLSQGINETIDNNIPSYLECEARICALGGECGFEGPPGKEIFVKSTLIAATLNNYNPKELKLFCWGI